MKTLTYEEYQEKVAGLKNMDDVAAFVKELVAPAVDKIGEEKSEAVPALGQRRIRTAIKQAAVAKRYEPAENDLEQNIIALYAKGLTTRDVLKDVQSRAAREEPLLPAALLQALWRREPNWEKTWAAVR